MLKCQVTIVASILLIIPYACGGCIQCNSVDDVRCATNPTQFLGRNCNDSKSECYIRIDKDGQTIRGCASELAPEISKNCFDEMECRKCANDACNSQIFPTHRARCLQCESSINGTCATETKDDPKYCPLSKLGEKCFIHKSATKSTLIRGCLSSSGNLCKKIENCYTCDGNGCNKLAANADIIPFAPDSGTFIKYSLLLILISAIFSTKLC